MKKLFLIIFTLFLFSENSFAKIILLNKCYIIEDYSIIKAKDGSYKRKFKSFEDYNKYSDYTNKNTLKDYYKEKDRKSKANILKRYNFLFEDVIYKISTKNQTVTRIWEITDQALQDKREYIRDLKKIKRKLKKEGKTEKEIPFYEVRNTIALAEEYPQKKMWQSSPIKIKQFYDNKLIFENKNGLYLELFTLNIKTGSVSADTAEGIIKENCQIGGKKRSHYLDYWWAVILIIAITFFIFTQSGKRLKKIRRK